MGDSDAQVACPPVVEYSAVDQTRAAAEVDALPEGAMVVRMLSDYAVLRDQARARPVSWIHGFKERQGFAARQ